MDSAVNREYYDFSKDYKALPIKKRAYLIKIAKILFRQQTENAVLLAESPPLPARAEKQRPV